MGLLDKVAYDKPERPSRNPVLVMLGALLLAGTIGWWHWLRRRRKY